MGVGTLPLGGTSAALIEAMARRALDAMPAEIRAQLGAVVIRVEDVANADMLASVGLDDPMSLSGLYSGRPLGTKSIGDSGTLPDVIHLFRLPILAEAAARRIPVEPLVAHVLVHEVGHHFGFSDDDMDALLDEA